MTELMIASPVIVGFLHAMRPFDVQVPVYSKDGRNAGTTLQAQPKQLTMTVKYSTDSIDHTKAVYKFVEEAGDLCSIGELVAKAGIDPEAVWAKAFDKARELFAATKEPSEAAKAVGISLYPRLDVVDAQIDLATTMKITFYAGIYTSPEYIKESMVSMLQMEFQDSKTFEFRDVELERMNQTITRLDQLIAGTHPNQAEMDAVALAESKTSAANDKRIILNQIEAHKKALIGPMSEVLSIPEVQNAFSAMGEAVFTELKAKLPEWAQIDLPTLMSFFPAAMEKVITA